MTARYRVTCTKKDGADDDRRIDGIGGPTGAKVGGGPWYLPIDRAIDGILDGTWTSYVIVQSREGDVVVREHPSTGRRYLTTVADGFPPNNLLALPDCSKRMRLAENPPASLHAAIGSSQGLASF